MTSKVLGRSAFFLTVAAALAACSSTKNPESASAAGDARVVTTSPECRLNRSACIYEGRYESGEKQYAEEEARRLNQASINRLRRVR